MVEAAVGHHCPSCVAEAATRTRQVQLPYGGQPSSNPQWTTMVLIALNVLVWVGITLTGGIDSLLASVLALTPSGVCNTPSGALVGVSPGACTGMPGTYVPGPLTGGWWQLITSAFTHESVLHLGFNLFVLWMLGPQVEAVLGRARFLAVYLISALVASAFVMWLAPVTTTTLGASGALLGLMGSLLVLAVHRGGDVRTILAWIAINAVVTFLGAAISWQVHLGGLVGGLAVTGLLVGLRRSGSTAQWLGLGGLAVVAVLASVARALVGG